jgi:hypothetical protein
MHDGSIFTMPNKHWQKAYEMKYSNSDQAEIKRIFTETTAKHWKAKTVPTKFNFDAKWGEFDSQKKYKNHADLGDEIMYVYIRAALLGIVFSEMSKSDNCKVIGINDNGTATSYNRKKAKLYKDLDDAFGKKRKRKVV